MLISPVLLQVEVDTVATTLALGEQNHAAELKRVCLEFVSRNLGAVMQSEGYQHMIRSCPQLQVRRCLPHLHCTRYLKPLPMTCSFIL